MGSQKKAYAPSEVMSFLSLSQHTLNFQKHSSLNTMRTSHGQMTQGIDVWNLGLVFAGLLQEKLFNHDTYRSNVYFPNLNFILDRLQTPEYKSTFMGDIASLEQTEVDEELNRIKRKLPQTAAGHMLRYLWDVVHQMLQVSPQKRPACMELLSQMQLTQTKLPDPATTGLHKNSIFSIGKKLPEISGPIQTMEAPLLNGYAG